MPIAGYNCEINITGTSTPMTGEACTLETTTVFQITDGAKEIFDPFTTFVVEDGGVPVAPAGYTIDYLFGRITFAIAPGGAVTVDGAYLPRLAVADASDFSFTLSREQLDMTTFSLTDAYRKRFMGLLDAEGSMNNLNLLATYGGETFLEILNDSSSGPGRPVVIDINMGGVKRFRSFALLTAETDSASVDSRIETEVSWSLASQNDLAYFGFDTLP